MRYIVIHHSGAEADSSAADIARHHIEHYGWPGCGYQFVIRWDGTIEQAWDLTVMSYNVASRNHEVVGICLPGDYTAKRPRPVQLASASWLARWLLQDKLPGARIVAHRNIALPGYETACPGDLWDEWKDAFDAA